jgi:hypothetical protein
VILSDSVRWHAACGAQKGRTVARQRRATGFVHDAGIPLGLPPTQAVGASRLSCSGTLLAWGSVFAMVPRILESRALLPVGLLLATSACIQVPEPPPAPEDLTALAAAYERPTASVPAAAIRALAPNLGDLVQGADVLRGLGFTRRVISDASVGLNSNTAIKEFAISGEVRASAPCVGDGDSAPTAPENGNVAVVLAVANSSLRRGFEGTLDRCVFSAQTASGEVERAVLSAHLVADLGADLTIGDELRTPLLIKLTEIAAEVVGGAANSLLGKGEFDFRLTADDAVESLIDGNDVGLAGSGTLLLGLRNDGTLSLRDRENEWICNQGAVSCKLSR